MRSPVFFFPWHTTNPSDPSEQYYSPDPAMIFSGVVACAIDVHLFFTFLAHLIMFPPAFCGRLGGALSGFTSLGGQWRVGLARDATHLFALRAGSDKVPMFLPATLTLSPCPTVQQRPSLCGSNSHVRPHPPLVRRRPGDLSRSSYTRNTQYLVRSTCIASQYDPQSRRRPSHHGR